MTPVLHFAANFWWLIFPFAGAIGTGVRAVAAANERRAQRRLERYRLKQQTKIAVAQAAARARGDEESSRRDLTKLLAAHARTDARWLEYEVDIAKLLDFPLMTNLRDPLTVAFHKAKRHADLLRPERPQDVQAVAADRSAYLDYRDAVHEYISAFEIAEAEAIRRRRSDFSADEQQRLARAQHLLDLAQDEGATREERQNAYARAGKGTRRPDRAAGTRAGRHRTSHRGADRGIARRRCGPPNGPLRSRADRGIAASPAASGGCGLAPVAQHAPP